MTGGRTLVILTRNLRWEDNPTLRAAAELGAPCIPCFVFNARQTRRRSPYFAANSFAFMVASLREMQRQRRGALRIVHMEGDPTEARAWERVVRASGATAVLTAWDGTPFARERAAALGAACGALGVDFREVRRDLYLTDHDHVRNQAGAPYRLYTPFAARIREEAAAASALGGEPALRIARTVPAEFARMCRAPPAAAMSCPSPAVRGGREEGLRLLARLDGFRDYAEWRNNPARQTSLLGAHLKYGTVSVREVWARVQGLFGPGHALLDQLLWREFFAYLLYHNPATLTEGAPLQAAPWKRDWERYDRAALRRWQEGRTGVALVDAGMRQLVRTGWMHGRARMVAANYLVFGLGVDWRAGERFFARHLIDYDVAQNLGNWQWAAGIGADPPKYGKPRIFNPERQADRYDPDGEYRQQEGVAV